MNTPGKSFKVPSFSFDTPYSGHRAFSNTDLLDPSTLKVKQTRVYDLQTKLDVILSHNTQLLAEISHMTDMLLAKDKRIAQLQRQGDKHVQFNRLNAELQRWKSEAMQAERSKSIELSNLRKKFQCELLNSMNCKKTNESLLVESKEQQLSKLRDCVSLRSYELEQVKMTHRKDVQRLGEQVCYLNGLVKHRQQIKENQIKELMIKHDSQLQLLQKQHFHNSEIASATAHKQIARLKNQINSKALQISAIQAKLSSYSEFGNANQEKKAAEHQQMRLQLQRAISLGIEAVQQEREKQRQLGKKQIQILEISTKRRQQLMKEEIEKLKSLLQSRSFQMQKIQSQILSQRELLLAQIASKDQQLAHFKHKISQTIIIDNLEQEALKIKMTQLSEADIRVLLQQLQTQGQHLTQQLRRREKQLEDKTNRVEELIKQKTSLRKAFQELVQELRAQNQKLRIRLEQSIKQLRQANSIGSSKLDVQSSTMNRENEGLKKTISFLQDQKAKLRQVIDAKDSEILLLNQRSSKNKFNWDEDRQQLQQRLQDKDLTFQELERLRLLQIEQLKSQMQRRRQLQQEEARVWQSREEDKVKQVQSLLKRIQQLEKCILIQQRSKEDMSKRNSNLQSQYNSKIKELQRLQAQALLDHQNVLQRSQNNFHNRQKTVSDASSLELRKLQRQMEELRELLRAKEEEILVLREKCKQTESKVIRAGQNAQKLKSIQSKVLNLGIDSSLIKNFQDLFKRERR